MKSMKRKIIIGMAVLLLAACGRNNRLEQALEFAGENRPELEKVLEHYRDSGLKYRAACYLIERLPGCYTYNDSRIDSLKQLKWFTTQYDKLWSDSVEQAWQGFDYRMTEKVYDIDVITADYLIENIDVAFAVWEKAPWSRYYSFDDFCRYVLPYRIGDEPLESWRSTYLRRYAAMVDSIYSGSDVVKKVQAVRTLFFPENESFGWNERFNLPHLGAHFLMDHRVGVCRESCDFTIYLLRSLGIPADKDFYRISPYTTGTHSWTVLKDTTGLTVPFWLVETDVKRGGSDGRPKGKVFRQSYWGAVEDVTAEYFGKNRAEVDVCCPEGVKEVSICIFSKGTYTPIAYAEATDGKAVFDDLEPGIRFQPMYSRQGVLHPAGYTFSIDTTGVVHYYKPDTLHRRTAILYRKYPWHWPLRRNLAYTNGLLVEGDVSPQFHNPVPLTHVADTIKAAYRWVVPESSSPVRYVRLTAPGGHYMDIAEITFLDSQGEKVKAAKHGTPPDLNRDNNVTKMLDGDILTYYHAPTKEKESVILELERRCVIGKIGLSPRNDDNFIRPGDTYELFYQDGAEGWKSLGRQTAEADSLVYDNIPTGALLWLRDLTRGREEQTFILREDGTQYFYWNHGES